VLYVLPCGSEGHRTTAVETLMQQEVQ